MALFALRLLLGAFGCRSRTPYGPESVWSDTPTALRRWGRTILVAREAFREAVETLNAGSK